MYQLCICTPVNDTTESYIGELEIETGDVGTGPANSDPSEQEY